MLTQPTTTTFTIDPAHTHVDFAVRHMMISKVRGSFAGIAGSIEANSGSGFPETVAVTLAAASIGTNTADRDAHLRSADFLDAEHFPEIRFVSTSVERTDDQHFTLNGDLTIRDTTRRVALDGEIEGRAKDPWGNDRIAYSAVTRISRKEFGLTWNQALETGGVMVGDDIDIALAVEAIAPLGTASA
ncbi:MAG: YceI family protein [Candidatus Baltobacteraceae bacterium]